MAPQLAMLYITHAVLFKRSLTWYPVPNAARAFLQETFERVKRWVTELRTQLGSEVPLLIVGNKIDLEDQRAVDMAEAERCACVDGCLEVLVAFRVLCIMHV